MGKLTVFNFLSLNGYFAGPNGDISWAHDSEENDFAAESLKADSMLLFGRVTYELMVHPVALDDGTPFLKGIKHPIKMKTTTTRPFKGGLVLHCYVPVGKGMASNR